MTGRPALPIHPLLIAGYPVIQLLGNNMAEVPVRDVVWPLAITLGVAAAIWLAAWPVFRSSGKSAILSSITIVPLLFLRPIHERISDLGPWLGHPFVFVALGALSYLLLLAGLLRLGRPAVDGWTRVLNVFGAALMLFALLPVARFYAGQRVESDADSADLLEALGLEVGRCRTGGCPDIYYVLVDGYGRSDVLRTLYGIDNEPFLTALAARGFFVATRSTSNYSQTRSSIASVLNIDYPHDPRDGAGSFSIDTNKVARVLQGLGYEYILVPSGYPITNRSTLADLTIEVGKTQTETTALLVERSALNAIIKSQRQKRTQMIELGFVRTLDGALRWHRRIKRSFEIIGEIADRAGPKFVFAHIVSPHPPYVFDHQGEMPPESLMSELSDPDAENFWDSPKYAGQLAYLNEMLLKTVDEILNRTSGSPVIIVHSDHGTFKLWKKGDEVRPSDELVRERMSILLTVHAPPEVVEHLYDGITPVNLFRLVFRTLFDSPLRPLEDRNFWSYTTPPREVTSIVREGRRDLDPPAAAGTGTD